MVSLELQDVGVRNGRNTVVSGVTTPPIRGGTLTAVIGPNAAGKSSLFRRISGLVSGPGRVRVSGPSVGDKAICYIAAGYGHQRGSDGL